jgi:hypothetical protein
MPMFAAAEGSIGQQPHRPEIGGPCLTLAPHFQVAERASELARSAVTSSVDELKSASQNIARDQNGPARGEL